MITAELVGDAEVVRKLDALPDRLRTELKIGIGNAVIKLQRKVKQDKLSGQVLNVRTDKLRGSIGQVVEEIGDTISGVVSTPVKYAPPLEYGFHGTVTVREHLRQIKQAFGRPIEPKQVTVRSYDMKINLPERSFLRSALRELEAQGIPRAEIDAAIARAVK